MRHLGMFFLVAVGFWGLAAACDGGNQSGSECGDGVCQDGEDTASCPEDCSVCDNNAHCDVAGGENGLNCPGDCPLCYQDSVCNREGGENGLNCPADCVLCLVDSICDESAGETRQNCPADCVGCNNDGVCDTADGESSQNCLADCPACIIDGDCNTATGETRQNCPADCPLCNDDGICDTAEGESNTNCPGDCVGTVDVCDLAAMEAGPAPHDYLVSDLFIPTTPAEAASIGMDLDGDGVIDNRLGDIMALLIANGAGDPNPMVNFDINEGFVTVPLRLYVDAWTGDATIMLLAYQGEPQLPAPAFDGSDVLTVTAGSPTDLSLCGPYASGVADVGPGQLLIPIPLFSQTVFVPLQQAQVEGPMTETAWTDVIVGGGITETDVDQVLLPALVVAFNDALAADPGSVMSATVMDMFDGNCADLGGFCAGVVAGVGACANNLPTDVDPITITELRCNMLLSSALTPDVDSDADGVDDLLSVGFVLQAVSAIITNL